MALCANAENTLNDQLSPCLKQASNACTGCFLVQYCSKGCQKAHWSIHKSDCRSPFVKVSWKPSWDTEGRRPAFITAKGSAIGTVSYGGQKYMWGNVPALDLLRLEKNEGIDTDRDFRLLFAASGDIRNIVKTLKELPTTYTGNCELFINDRDPDIVARNVILLLTALHFSPDEAAPIMLHMWYSAMIPERMLRVLQDNLLPPIQEVCNKIQTKPAKCFFSKTWTYGMRSLRLVLTKEQWKSLPAYLIVPDGLSALQAQAIRTSTTLASERKDYVERELFVQPPVWRVCKMKFRKDGILLPFGSSRKGFDTPNPTFYQTNKIWPMKDSADPIQGWQIEEVIEKVTLAKNDIYGSLFIYLQDILLQFCRCIHSHKVHFRLFQVDAVLLPKMLELPEVGQCSFDKIELSNIADRGYLGPHVALVTFSPLLKRRTQNPNAVLLTLFLNAVHEVFSPNDYLSSLRSDMGHLQRYMVVSRGIVQHSNPSSAAFLRLVEARTMLRDFDHLFERYMRECRFDEIGKEAGLKMSSNNVIIPPWPMRLKKDATQQEFDLLHASSHNGSERYVEWNSAA